MISAGNDFITAMQSPQSKVYIKIELYDSSMTYISEITQQVESNLGTLNMDITSPIRRSFSLSLDNSLGQFIFGEGNTIWIDKRIKLFISLQKWDGTLEYIPLGVFVLTTPQSQHDKQTNNTTINAVDKAYFYINNRGKFVNNLTIQTGAKITDTIRSIASDVGETMFNFDNITDTVPYDLTYSPTDNRWKALQELAQIAQAEIFYDVFGYLRLRKIDLTYFDNEPISWTYQAGDNFYAGATRQLDDTNLFNDIVVLGGSSTTATSSYRLTVDETNPIWAGNPYSVQKIGWSSYLHNNGSPDPLLTSNDLCKFRAKFELRNRLGFTEKVQMTIFPNYLHDCGDIVFISDPINGIEGSKYMIQQITLPLAPSTMTLNVVKYNQILSDWSSF